MMPSHHLATFLLFGSLVACGTRGPASHVPSAAAQQPIQIGTASYYHDSLAGNLTANAERYDPRAFSAAHRTLPFGSVVDVVRRDGRSVRVRVNDRGPYVDGRIIDLSRQAAESLGMIRAGIVEVALYLVWAPPAKTRARSKRH
jgi:rare lipoprotein A